jgi:hypothetical protein
MEPHISIITLGVDNLKRSVAFYADGLGLPFAEDFDPDEDGIAFFEVGPGLRLALYPWDKLAEDAQQPPDGEGFRGVTLAHNVRRRDRVDAVIAEAADAGAEIVKEPEEVFWGGYSGYFADPDGHLWEVAFNPYDEIAEEA